jgi:3-hexulose-6-phosphate synthase
MRDAAPAAIGRRLTAGRFLPTWFRPAKAERSAAHFGKFFAMTSPDPQSASERLRQLLRSQYTFQISVDTDNLPQGLVVAEAALAAGIALVEMGTPLLKCEGVNNVVPAFRRRFPEALLLADMKTMDGGGFEAHTVFQVGGNIIDFLAISGVATAKGVCAARDAYRGESEIPRLVFADILLPQQGPAGPAVDAALRMVEAGVDGVGLHLQHDARRADPALFQSSYLADTARAVFERVGEVASVQVVGGLSIAQAQALARDGLRAFVISGNMGLPDSASRYDLPPAELQKLIADFISRVSIC